MMQKVVSFLGATECPDCHIALKLNDITQYDLDINGSIKGETKDEYLICSECGKRFEALRDWEGQSKVYTELELKLDMYKIMDNLDKKIISNPFVKGDD